MLRSEAIAEIKRGLGFRTTQDATIIAALKEAQRILELGHTLPRWLLAYENFTATTDTAIVDLGTRFIRIDDNAPPYFVAAGSSRVTFLKVLKTQEAYEAYIGAAEDPNQVDSSPTTALYPKAIAILNKLQAAVYPIVTEELPIAITYYKNDELLDSDIENKWLTYAPDVLIGMAGMRVASIVRDKDALSQFQSRAALGGKSFMGDIIEDELAGRPLIMGRNN